MRRTGRPIRASLVAVTAVVAVLALSPIAACGGSSGAPGTAALEHRWILTSFGRASADRPASVDRPAEMTLDAAGRVTGDTGCNSFGGSWSITGDTLRLGEVAMTLRGCVGDDVIAQEEAISRALSSTKTATVDGDRLTIRATDGSATLVFERGD